MKKLYFCFLLFPLWGLGGFSRAQSVNPIDQNFDENEVVFSVDVRPAATTTWVFVDYSIPSHNPANILRATFSSVSIIPAQAGSWTAGDRGFRLTGSATVTAKLEGVSGKFSWCAYAIDAPPNARVIPEGGYELLGTPPFIINGIITISAGTFGPGACIYSITDDTDNPDGFFPPPPEVTATAPTTVCAGAVTFTATATGGTTTAMSYTWNIAGAETTTTTNPYITTLDAGEYTCTVRVTNANGCTSTVAPAGTVTVYAVPAVHTVSSATICYGVAAALSATVSGTTTPTYTWVIDGAITTTTTNTYITSALTATTTYTVQITNDDTGCMSLVSAVGTVTVPPLLEPKFESAPSAACPNSEVMFTVSGASTDTGGSYCFTYECSECVRNPFLTGKEVPAAVHCLWDSECKFGTANTYSVVMPDAGNMTVWVQAIDQYGCTNTASTAVAIIAVPAITAVNTPTICYGATVALSATAVNAPAQATYTWNIEGYSETWTSTNTYTTPALTATATYTVQITNDTGCTTTAPPAGRIMVCDPFDAGSIDAGTQTICKGAAVTTIGNTQGPAGGGENYTYRWIHNGTDEINENTPAFQPTAYQNTPGTHTFTREVHPGCNPGTWAPSSNTWTFVVIDLPPKPEDASSVVICADNTATFSASVDDAEAIINWYAASSGGSTVCANAWSYTPDAPLTATTSYYAEASHTATGCVSAERLQVTTTVNAVPVVNAVSASICYNTAATLTASATSATVPATYTWEINSAATTTNTNTYTMPARTANVTYTVQIVNSTGCTSTVSNAGTITVYEEFTPGAITTDEKTICSGEEVNTIASSSSASGGNTVITYQWRRISMNSTTITTNAPDYTPTAYNATTGAHTFTRWAKDGQCSGFIPSAGSYVLTVNARPATPSNASSMTICAGNTVTFSASVTAEATIDWYDAPTGGSTVLVNSWSYTPDAPLTTTTTYYAEARNTTTHCVSTARLPVKTTVNPLPVILVDGVPGSACVDDVLNVQASGAFAGGSYCFSSYVDGIGNSGCTYTEANTYSVTVPATGTTTIRARAMTAKGCVDSVLVSVPDMSSPDCINSAGTISSNSVTAILGAYPPRTAAKKPTSEAPAANQNATYEWRRTGTSSAILANSNVETYIITEDEDALYTAGTYYYNRYIRDGTPENSVGLRADGTYTLVVVAPPFSPAGTVTKYRASSCEKIWSGPLRQTITGATHWDRGSTYGYYYSRHAHTGTDPCPSPWRKMNSTDCGCYDTAWRTTPGFQEHGIRWRSDNTERSGGGPWYFRTYAPSGCCHTYEYWRDVSANCPSDNRPSGGAELRAPLHCVASYDY